MPVLTGREPGTMLHAGEFHSHTSYQVFGECTLLLSACGANQHEVNALGCVTQQDPSGTSEPASVKH